MGKAAGFNVCEDNQAQCKRNLQGKHGFTLCANVGYSGGKVPGATTTTTSTATNPATTSVTNPATTSVTNPATTSVTNAVNPTTTPPTTMVTTAATDTASGPTTSPKSTVTLKAGDTATPTPTTTADAGVSTTTEVDGGCTMGVLASSLIGFMVMVMAA